MIEEKILKLTNICHQYDKKYDNWVLKDISFNFTNKKYVLMGPSGIGKSTLLHIITNIIKPTHGHIKTNHKFGSIFQNLNLLSDFTLRENISIAAKIKKYQPEYMELAKFCDVVDILDKFPSQISGGQKQRGAIIRALSTGATFLIADEPTDNLDEQNAQIIRNLFNLLNEELSIGWIVSSHDPSWLTIAHEKLTLKSGNLVYL